MRLQESKTLKREKLGWEFLQAAHRAVNLAGNILRTGLYPGGRTPCGAGLGQRIFAWGVETDGLDLICALRTDPEEVSHQ